MSSSSRRRHTLDDSNERSDAAGLARDLSDDAHAVTSVRSIVSSALDAPAPPRTSGLFPAGSGWKSAVDPLAPLAARALLGDADAQRALLEELVRPLRRFLKFALVSADETEDTLQESLIAVLGALPGYRGESSVLHFSIGVARRLALAQCRTSSRYAKHIERAIQLERPLLSSDALRGDGVMGPRLRAELIRLLDELPEEQARAFVLRSIFDCSLREIAAETRVPVNTVRTRLRLARKFLRRRIESDH